jgi:kynureninase
MATIQTTADWQKQWFEISDATYLNTAAHAAMPRVSLHAVQVSLDAKRFPHHINDSVWFETPNRIRASLSKMIGAKPEEIALTTGASTGVAAVAHAWHGSRATRSLPLRESSHCNTPPGSQWKNARA